jgi:hypothetical protein
MEFMVILSIVGPLYDVMYVFSGCGHGVQGVLYGTVIYFVGFEVFTAVVMKSIIFWDVTPCSPLSCDRRFEGTYRLHLQGRRNNFSLPPAYLLVRAEIISSTLKMEAICSSETSVATQQTTRRHIPEDDTLYYLL